MVKVWKVGVCVSVVAAFAAGVASAGGPIDLTRVGQPTASATGVQGVQLHATAQILAPVVVLDNFNRADGSLGSNWIVQTGSFGIVSNTARGSSAGLATFVGGSGAALEADVATNGTLSTDYVALVLNYADPSNNLFLKVQTQNSAGTFDTAGCYIGNNGDGTPGSFGLNFFTLSAPFATAHMRVELVGTDVTMTFTNIDGGAGTQTYTCTGAPATGGTGIGMGGLANAASLDNFAGAGAGPAAPAIPAAGSLGLLLLALALLGSGLAWLARRS
ncbi:MAG: hypothetical protein PHQ91_15060 [Thermoanaerobaculaceae bacterium]|nr:hypothetical protein [Thermoanaerobaculaceae bacterium]